MTQFVVENIVPYMMGVVTGILMFSLAMHTMKRGTRRD